MLTTPKVFRNQNIGFIGNYFTEQLLQREYKVKLLEKGFCETTVIDSQLNIVFVDTEFFNISNSWREFSLLELIDYLESLDLIVLLITYREEVVIPNYYHLYIHDSSKTFKKNKVHSYLPYLINEHVFNPVNQKKTNTLIVLDQTDDVGNLELYLSEQIHKYIKEESQDFKLFNFNDLSKSNLLKLVKYIKNSKAVYIDKPEEINKVILKYVELICAAQNTFLVVKSNDNQKDNYYISHEDEITLIYILKSFDNKSIFNDHNLIRKSRQSYLNNSLMQFNNLSEIINGNILEKKPINISVVTSTIRKHNLKKFIIQMNKQHYVNLEIILLTHGFKLNVKELEHLKDLSIHPITILSENSNVVYGKCLNKCLDNITYEYFAKVDDDDFYYPNYLIDSWISYQYSRAEIVGKHSTFWYIESQNLIAERFQSQVYKYTKYVAGATLFSSAEFIKEYKFSPLASGIDRDLLMRADADKHRIFCNNPYEFCVYRDNDASSHTWKVDELYILRSATIKFLGAPQLSLTVDN